MLELIDHPKFSVEYSQFNSPTPTVSWTKSALDYQKFLIEMIQCCGKAIKQNASSATRRFTVCVVNVVTTDRVGTGRLLYGSIVLIFWIVYEIFQLQSTARYFYYQKHPQATFKDLQKVIDPQVNLFHLQVTQEKIDTSHIPAEMTVDKLLPLFNTINFSDPQLPGYIDPTLLKNDDKATNVEELSQGLNTLISNIKDKKALLGTPPASSPLLDIFYQNLTDYIRYSLYVILVEMDPEKAKTSMERDDYLRKRSDLAIVLARAGLHCASRYMGEAVQLYTLLSACKTGQNLLSLEARYYNMLANKRLKIAERRIAAIGRDTHVYAAYMAVLAPPLGLPGLRDVVEHLGLGLINKQNELKLFCDKYTPGYLKRKTFNMIRKNQDFKELVYDWMADHMGNWNSASYQKLKVEFNQELMPLWIKLTAPQNLSEEVATTPADLTLSHLKSLNLLIHLLKNLNQTEIGEIYKDLNDERDEEAKKQMLVSSLLNRCSLFPLSADVLARANKKLTINQAVTILSSYASPLLAALEEASKQQKLVDLSNFPEIQKMRHHALLTDRAYQILKLCHKDSYQLPANLTSITDCLKRDQPEQALNAYIEHLFNDMRKQEFLAKLHVNDQLHKNSVEWFMLAHRVIKPPVR